LNEIQRNRLLRLGSNLNAAWNDVSAPIELKKRIIRTLINEIVVDINHSSATLEMQIHWAGGVHTELKVRKNKMGHTANATDQNVVDLVRELAMVQPDSRIAATLNRLGYHSGHEKTWNETRVKSLRNYNQIPVFAKGCDRPWVTMEEAANILKTSVTVIRTMIRKQLVPAHQIVKHAPWTIRSEDLQRPEVREYAKGARPGKHAPRRENNQPLIPNL
jgi:helix-turn-helix protein